MDSKYLSGCFSTMGSLCWLRSDLRISDNTALWQARQAGSVIAVFYATPLQWLSHDMAGCRADFMMRSLRVLRESLGELGIPLVYREVDHYEDIASDIGALAHQFKANAVFWNREYALNEVRRDKEVAVHLERLGIAHRAYDDFYIFPPGSVRREDGGSYQIYTPFSRTWKSLLEARPVDLLPAPASQELVVGGDVGVIPAVLQGFGAVANGALWPAGEAEAQRRLQRFVAENLWDYAERRDFPALVGTAQLSPYLAIGALSARQCLQAALQINRGGLHSGSRSVQIWINELIWREFYGHILAENPSLSMHHAFRPEYEAIPWRQDVKAFKAWSLGQTGIPLVDAGMRQLLETGWMHNRVRMVTAMFLSKNLLLDWRLGERHFMRHLIDGDLAQNNGGWQWSASTGTDAAPYFRIFNPFTQAQRFDPEGSYIKRWVPELAGVAPHQLHNPRKLASARPTNYPVPIVDVPKSRARAIQTYKRALSQK